MPRKKALSTTRRQFQLRDQRLLELGYSSYQEYLDSPYWAAFRKENIKQACFVCGLKKTLQLHHITYARLGAELPADVRTLCNNHHDAIHWLARKRGGGSLDPAQLLSAPARKLKRRRKKTNLSSGALGISCPYCGAARLKQCRTSSGAFRSPHESRKRPRPKTRKNDV